MGKNIITFIEFLISIVFICYSILRACQKKCVNGYISCQQIGTRLSNSIAN